MNEFMTSLLLIGTQFGFLISIVFIVLLVLLIRRKKKDQDITTQFKEEIKSSSAQRLVNLEENIATAFKLNGQETKTYAMAIIKRERKIFSDVLKIFQGEDKSLILNLHDDLKRLNQTYQDLANQLSSGANGSEARGVTDEQLQETVKALKQENKELKEELVKSQESIDYLQVQYTELFDKANKENKDS